jgi:MFS family permease
MFCINAANYLDRFIVVAVGPALKSEFHLHDRAIGLLSTSFVLVYTVAALPLGLLADRTSRARLVSVVVGVWSGLSAGTALARTFPALFATRAAVGIGEAGYYPAGTALLSAYFPLRQRARIMARWQAAQFVGVSLAFVVSAAVFHWFGHGAWRLAFLVTGLPGLLLALLMWRVPDLPPTATPTTSPIGAPAAAKQASPSDDKPTGSESPDGEPEPLPAGHLPLPVGGSFADLREQIASVLRIPTVRVMIVIQALVYAIATPAVTFLPIYLVSAHSPFHVTKSGASLVAGAVTVLGGLTGVLLGGRVADRLSVRHAGGRVLTAALGFALALPCYIVMLRAITLPVFVVAGLIVTFMLSLQAGPLTAAIQDATPPAMRGTAVAVILLCGHLLGDVWAPAAVGTLSTALQERTAMALLLVGVPVLVLGVVAATYGARVYARDLARLPAMKA